MNLQFGVLFAAVALAACGGGGATRDVAYYDLGGSMGKRTTVVPLRGVDVHAPSWLATSAMQYRLAYADGARRHAYGESRWAAPPAELLESAARRGLAMERSDVAGLGGCRLKVDLDEFIQVFDSATESRAVIEARVSLLTQQGNPVVASRVLSLARQTASADARGGVAAFSLLGGEAVDAVNAWLNQLVKDSPKILDRCKA